MMVKNRGKKNVRRTLSSRTKSQLQIKMNTREGQVGGEKENHTGRYRD